MESLRRMSRVSDRLAWAVDVLDVARHDRILEVGCGHAWPSRSSASASTGSNGLDRSPKMIEMARETRRPTAPS
jgi:predicted TPR repeat methyltransferase